MAAMVAQDGETRVLLLAPTKKDARVTSIILRQKGIEPRVCETITELCSEIRLGAAAVLTTEEAIASREGSALTEALRDQPEWSDLPIVILMAGGVLADKAAEILKTLTNATLLERPASVRSVLSAVEAAIRGRERQYQMRAQLLALQAEHTHARELQFQLQNVLEASELGTFMCELPLDRVVWNERGRQHHWLTPDAEGALAVFYSALHPDDRAGIQQAIERCVVHHEPYEVEYRTVSPAGVIRWIRATGNTSFSDRGRAVRFEGTTQDITPRKALEAERAFLLESERAARIEAERANRMKDEFLATLSHELRTPLNAISGWTELLKYDGRDFATVLEGVEIIERNVRTQTELIEDLLDMSRIISGKVRLDIKPINLADVARAAIETVRPAAKAKGVLIRETLDAAFGAVDGDSSRLQQVVWNLLSNAVKFTPKDGQVHVVLEQVASVVRLSVIDTGAGIPPEFLPHIFERFRQADSSPSRRYGGLGLGLSIVKTLMEMHSGSVSVKSDGPGTGTSFQIMLPIRTLEIEPGNDEGVTQLDDAVKPPLIDAPQLAGIKILVVDDEQDSRDVICRLISKCGGVPQPASSADDASMQIVRFEPDLIVSDIGMPEKDGYTWMTEIRTQGVVTPAIALTAFARADDRERAIQAGFQFHLTKPIDARELLTAINSLCGRLPSAP